MLTLLDQTLMVSIHKKTFTYIYIRQCNNSFKYYTNIIKNLLTMNHICIYFTSLILRNDICSCYFSIYPQDDGIKDLSSILFKQDLPHVIVSVRIRLISPSLHVNLLNWFYLYKPAYISSFILSYLFIYLNYFYILSYFILFI